MGRIGFNVQREIEVCGPFAEEPDRDTYFAKATVTIQGQKNEVLVVVTGLDVVLQLSSLSNTDLQEALGWFALVELERTPSQQLQSSGGGRRQRVNVSIPRGNGQWTIQRVRDYKNRELRNYNTEYLAGDQPRWSARPKA